MTFKTPKTNKMQKRKAAITLLTLSLAVTSIVPGSFGTENPLDTGEKTSHPATVDVYDWFQIGEYLKACEYVRFYQSIADNLENTFTKFSDLLVKEHCSSQTLSVLKQLVEVCKTLPLKDPQHQWSNAELKPLWDAQGKLYNAIIEDEKKTPESCVFFNLGSGALDLAWGIPQIQSNQEMLKQRVESTGQTFATLSSYELYKGVYGSLNPDVVHAMEIIMSVSSKVADPMEELTDADISRAVEAGKVIRALGKQHKLLK